MPTFDTPGPLVVDVRNAAGSVRLDLVDSDTSTVDVELVPGGPLAVVDEIVRTFGGRHSEGEHGSRWWEPPDGAQAQAVLDRVRIDLSERSGRTTLVVDTDPAARGWRTAFAVHVTAPRHSSVQLATQSADTRLTGTVGDLRARSASGNVLSEDIAGAVEISTASGDVRVHSVGGELRCRTASGDVDAAAVGGAVVVHTASGDARLGSVAGDVEVRTVSGDIRIADLSTGLAQLTAVSGTIDICLHPGSLAAVSMTTISGSTRSDFDLSDSSAAVDPQDAEPGADAGVTDAEPQLDIRARTTSGDIRLRRSASASSL